MKFVFHSAAFRALLSCIVLFLTGVSAIILPISPMLWAGEILTLARAETLALEHAPGLQRYRANADAASERAVYAERLPDPQLTLGAMNVPADSLNLRDENMTMLSIGVRQSIPPGDTLLLRGQRAREALTREEAIFEVQYRVLLRQTRQLWFELYAQEQSLGLIEHLRDLQQQAVEETEGRYRAAQELKQEVLRERQTLTRLDARTLTVRPQVARLRAQLRRLIGDASADALPTDLPMLPDMTEFNVARHPEWLAMQSGVDMASIEAELARQEYKPGIMFDLSYGFRQAAPNGMDRPDMLTAMVTFDLPLFTGRRQDRRVAEQRALETSARLELEDKRRELEAIYAAARAEHGALAARVALITERLLPDMQRETRISAGAARDADLRRMAQMKVIDTELELIRLRTELKKVEAELLYLAGEISS